MSRGTLYLKSYHTGVLKGGDVININVARGYMKGINYRLIHLAPSQELFSWYRNNMNRKDWFDIYCKRYMNQFKTDPEAIRQINEIKHLLDEGRDVCIYCFCKNVNKCHRGILGHLFSRKGYTVKVL